MEVFSFKRIFTCYREFYLLTTFPSFTCKLHNIFQKNSKSFFKKLLFFHKKSFFKKVLFFVKVIFFSKKNVLVSKPVLIFKSKESTNFFKMKVYLFLELELCFTMKVLFSEKKCLVIKKKVLLLQTSHFLKNYFIVIAFLNESNIFYFKSNIYDFLT